MSRKAQQLSKSRSKLRSRRIFSDTFKRQKVKELEAGLLSIAELSKLYSVSRQAIYKWLHKYSPHHKKGTVQVVQMESESKKTQQLLERVKDLERHVGLKQLEIDYLNKLLEVSSEELKIDLKKNFGTKFSTNFTKPLKDQDLK